jgi:acetyl/propionyl-CoA carboxylase alpha subunit
MVSVQTCVNLTTLITHPQQAKKVGYPIMIKAVLGGGGKVCVLCFVHEMLRV